MKLVEIPEQTPVDDLDEEILEIFVEEVSEIIEEISNNFQSWSDSADDTESLKSLRRAFHTLKGSGRLVGATVIGEFGWRFENMFNKIIEGVIPKNDKVLTLVAQVENVLPGMIQQFRAGQPPEHKVLVLISQADYLTQTKGESIGDFEGGETVAPTPPPAKPQVAKAPPPVAKPVQKPVIKQPVELELEEEEVAFEEESATAQELTAFDEELELGALDNKELLETEETQELGQQYFDLSEDVGDSEALLSEDFKTVESEQTSSQVTGFSEELLPLSDMPFSADEESDELDPVLLDIFRNEASSHLSHLREFLDAHLAKREDFLLNQDIIRAFHTLNGSSRSVHFLSVSTIAGPMETYTRLLHERKIPINSERLQILNQASHLIEKLLNNEIFDEIEQKELLNRIQTSTRSLDSGEIGTSPIKSTVSDMQSHVTSKPAMEEAAIPDAGDEFMAIFLEEAEEILENTQSLLEKWQVSPNNMQLMKELQRELHTLKGGARMVGIAQMGDLSHHLESILTRIVEGTLQSSPKLQETVQNSVDELAAMLEAVRSSVPLEMPNDLINQIKAFVEPSEGTTPEPLIVVTTQVPIPEDDKPATRAESVEKEQDTSKQEKTAVEKDSDSEVGEDRIRVRVTLIDKLTNLAGEMSISRAHMEQQQAALKTNISEMEQTVIRLRDQLRRLEIETEAQIISHFSDTQGYGVDTEEFDPLELDRFSVMQQLSRSLMESVSDLMSIQDFLKTLTRQNDTLLIQQSRIGAELQEGIMRTRMIPFSRISPRLQRIARLTARELRKQVEFVINGENIEFERTVLNRVVAPLEHMLRNAIGHGIEPADVRQQSGKSPIATVTIDLAREGTELIIKLSDDGGGLNLTAIRKKAEERGMVKSGAVISEQELMQFILEPSFSTASVVTQISGRGVGMDVVNNEVKQLGGSLQIYSKTGKGTTFEIRLPLSLTINQALLVYVGEEMLAIPLNHVDAVLRAPRQEVIKTDDEEIFYKYMEKDYRVFHLGEVLGMGKISSVDSPLIPTLLLRVGSRRVALLVDGIEGSKEVVVKSVGPQISSIPWIAGATILGNGRVVVILDVPTIARVDTKPQYDQISAPDVPLEEEKQPVTTIMVVDDSITVRKVTARLLKRQGMEVLTAKDGVDAVAQLQEHVPDLMLLDVEMPRMDGYELATQVRNTSHLKHIPIIMITSRTGTKHRDRAEKIGINRYLGKPFNETELLENINALLAETAEIRKVAMTGLQKTASI